MKINWYKVLYNTMAIGMLLWLLAVVLTLNACNVVKKQSSKSIISVDSTAVTSSDSSWLKKSASTNTKIEEGEYERESFFVYDTIYLEGDTIYKNRIVYVKEKGKYKKGESLSTNTSDSGSLNTDANINLKKDSKTIDKKKDSWRMPWWLGIIGGLVVGGLLVHAYKQYFK